MIRVGSVETNDHSPASSGKQRVLCVLSGEQWGDYEEELTGLARPGVDLVVQTDPEEALNQVERLEPGLILVGMTLGPVEGLEFLAMFTGRYPKLGTQLVVLPDRGDPFPPMLQCRDPATGKSTTEEIDLPRIGELMSALAPPKASPPKPAEPAPPKAKAAEPAPPKAKAAEPAPPKAAEPAPPKAKAAEPAPPKAKAAPPKAAPPEPASASPKLAGSAFARRPGDTASRKGPAARTQSSKDRFVRLPPIPREEDEGAAGATDKPKTPVEPPPTPSPTAQDPAPVATAPTVESDLDSKLEPSAPEQPAPGPTLDAEPVPSSALPTYLAGAPTTPVQPASGFPISTKVLLVAAGVGAVAGLVYLVAAMGSSESEESASPASSNRPASSAAR